MISDALYDLCMKKAEEANHKITLNHKFQSYWDCHCGCMRGFYDIDLITRWIHLADAVDLGNISPLDAYDALSLGYVPSYLEVRKSRYSHLL